MSYLVLARKYRPQTFADLVGQEHVSRTLANAIATERVAHAFLFTGVRGVGKTTSARILAKALNCQAGPTVTPCLACPACREIAEGTDVDVQEIDGASYNGVDEVRKLQESLPYRPQRDRSKIYIVDEVHMLSTPAWNAFLKTLEEPPPHVKFVFATTEAHKVPVTILSRCQRYDFKLITTDEIAARLRLVLKSEGIAADDEATRILAREAAGSMRDAMSLLDQVIAWSGGQEALGAEAVGRVLGVAVRSVLHQLGAALVGSDPASCLAVVGALATQGYSLAHVARDLLQYLRDLVVAKVARAPAGLLDLADAELADVLALAARADLDDLSRLYLGFSRAFDDIVRSAQPREALEMALVRLSRRPPLLPLDELVRRLADLEQRLGKAGAGPDPATSSSSPRSTARGVVTAPAPAARPAAAPPVTARLRARAEPPATTSAPPPAAPPAAPAALEDWLAILAAVGARQPQLAAIYERAVPVTVGAGRIVLGFEPGSFEARGAQQSDALALLGTAASAHFGCATAIAIDLSDRHGGAETVAGKNEAEQSRRLGRARERVAKHPLVVAAAELLGAELREVRLGATEDRVPDSR